MKNMRRHIIAILICFAALPAAGREVYNLNGGWKFFTGRATTSDNARTVTLPRTWNSDATAGNDDYYRGTGNYLREVSVPAEWSGRRVFIKGYGANSIATVFVNGRLAGEHRGGYTAFCFEITGLLRMGAANYFRIVVNNSPQLDVLPTAGDHNVYGGLFRDVELIVTGQDAISPTDNASDGVYIKQKNISRQRVEAEAEVKIAGSRDANLHARLTVVSAEGDTVAVNGIRVRTSAGREATVAIPFAFDNPRLWDGRKDPHLYTVGIELTDGENVLDAVAVETGFRTVSADPASGFFLNGEPYQLRGVVAHQDRPLSANVLTLAQVGEDVEMIAGMGANAVRVWGMAHHPEFYHLCDRAGILVWSDFPFVGEAYLTDKAFVDTQSFRENGIAQATDIIRQQYNHPSVVIWGIFSNVHMRNDNPVPFIRQLDALARSEDPSRLTAASSNADGELNFITDLVCWQHHFGWQEGQPADINIWKRPFLARWRNLRSAVSYGAGASIHHQGPADKRPDHNGNWHPEQWQTCLHEAYYENLKSDSIFWGTFICNMFDYGAVGRDWGEDNGVNDMGLVTFDRKERKDAYFFYKANWNDHSPFVYIAERRRNKRSDPVQDIKFYTNIDEAELFVNGFSQGRKEAVNGTTVWEGVALKEGVNLIEARAGDQRDFTRIEIRSGADEVKTL